MKTGNKEKKIKNSFFIKAKCQGTATKAVEKNDVQVRRGPGSTAAQMVQLARLEAGVVAGVRPSRNQLCCGTACRDDSIWQSRWFPVGHLHCAFIWKDSCWRQAHLIQLTQRGTQWPPRSQTLVHLPKSIWKAKAHIKQSNKTLRYRSSQKVKCT